MLTNFNALFNVTIWGEEVDFGVSETLIPTSYAPQTTKASKIQP